MQNLETIEKLDSIGAKQINQLNVYKEARLVTKTPASAAERR